MALATYADLKSEIGNWMNGRTDLATDADTFIDLAEGDFNRVFRVREMETYATLSPDANGEASLPSDYLQWRTVTAQTSPRSELQFVPPSYLDDQYPDRAAGYPRFFTIYGSTMLVLPLTESDIRLDYYETIPALSDAQTTNWLLTKYPNVYLYQCLKHAAVFLNTPSASSQAQTYGALANAAIDALMRDDERARYTRTTMRVSGPTP